MDFPDMYLVFHVHSQPWTDSMFTRFYVIQRHQESMRIDQNALHQMQINYYMGSCVFSK